MTKRDLWGRDWCSASKIMSLELCGHVCTLFHGHRGQTSEAFFVLISWTSWRKWQGCIESFVIVTCNLPTNTVKDITVTKDVLIFD